MRPAKSLSGVSLLLAAASIGLVMIASRVSAADTPWFAGVQAGAATLSARMVGAGSTYSEFSHNATQHGSLIAGRTFQTGQRHYRWTLSLDHGRWEKARSTSLLTGVDYRWANPKGTGALYLGPRIGVTQFSDDVTNDQNTVFTWGVELGALQDLPDWGRIGGRSTQAGLFLRHSELNLTQQGSTENALERDIEIDRQTIIGVQLLLPF